MATVGETQFMRASHRPALTKKVDSVLSGECFWIDGIGLGHQYAFRYPVPLAKRDPLALLVLRCFAPVDYAPLAFQPETWKTKGHSTMLLPWTGSNVVFLTTPGTYDGQLMAGWVRALDGGWAL